LLRWIVPIAAAAWAVLLLVGGTIDMSEVPVTLVVAAANALPFALVGWAVRERSEALAQRRVSASSG
jgi:hypothetical protein